MEGTLAIGPRPASPGGVQGGTAALGILRTTPLGLGPQAPFLQLADGVGLGPSTNSFSRFGLTLTASVTSLAL